MGTMLPKVLEIERHQLADYARVDYAITKGEDEIAALEELCLGPNELRREASVVRDRTVLAVREVRNNMAKRAITAKNMQGSLVESLRQRSRFSVVDTVDASLRARCFASLECIPTLTLLCHFIDAMKAGDFARAESVRFEFLTREDRHEYVVTSRAIFAQFAPFEPSDILKRIAKICLAAELTNALSRECWTRSLRITAHRHVSSGVAPCQSEILSLKKVVWRQWLVSKSRTKSSVEGCEQLLRRAASVARPSSSPSHARSVLS